MLFWIERFGIKIFVEALLNCGRWHITFWQDSKRVKPTQWMQCEVLGYIEMFSDKPIEFA